MPPFRLLTAALVVAAALVLCGCTTTTGGSDGGNTAGAPHIPLSASTSLLRPGDSLIVSLQGVPDASHPAVQIDEQGLITLPYIGPVPAAGASSAELSQRIRETYFTRKIYNAVDVSVTVTERYIYVGGEVQRPGRIVWTPDLTLTKAIQSAGGFTLYARESAVNLVRDNQAYTIDSGRARRTPEADPALIPGDSVQVTRSAF